MPHQVGEAREVQVHAGDDQPVGRHHVELLSARGRRASASVSNSMHDLRRASGPPAMHRVAPDEQLPVAGADHERGVGGRVAGARDGGDAGEDLALLEKSPAVLVRRLLARGLETASPGLRSRLRYLGVVEPALGLVSVYDELGVGGKVVLALCPCRRGGNSGRDACG